MGGLPLLMVMPQMGPKKAEVDQRKQKRNQLLKRLVVKVGVDQRKQQNQRKRNLQRRLKMEMMPKRQQGKVKRDLNKHLEAEKLIVLQFFSSSILHNIISYCKPFENSRLRKLPEHITYFISTK